MNVAQELGDSDLYNYDVLVKLLGDRFDPASRVSASRSRFHARSRRHHEDADAFADTLGELCRVGYPQNPPELRQQLIAEQFVRGQSDPELKKYLWVVIRTQKDRKLQTLIEVCTDFSSLVTPHTFTDQPNRLLRYITKRSRILKRLRIWRMSLSWATVHHGIIEDLRTRPRHPAYNRCLHWHVAWDMRCARSPDSQMLNADLRGIALPLTRIADSVLKHVPAGTTRGSSASVVESLVTC